MHRTYKLPKRFIFTQSFNDCRRGEVYVFNNYVDKESIYYTKRGKTYRTMSQWSYETLCLLVKNSIVLVF